MAYVWSRGLTEETAWATGLGYNPGTVYDAGEQVGAGIGAAVAARQGW